MRTPTGACTPVNFLLISSLFTDSEGSLRYDAWESPSAPLLGAAEA